MASPVLLLSVLLSALAAVNPTPLDKAEHPEELVTRCIVEVLSNALGKANAPPINPECREILKKSGQHVKEEKKNGGEEMQYDQRLLQVPNEAEIQQHMNDKGHQQSEEEVKRHMKESDEKQHLEEEEDRKDEEEKRHIKDKDFSEEDEAHEEDRNESSKKRSGEIEGEGVDNMHHHSQERNKEKIHHNEDSENLQHQYLDKRPHSAGGSREEYSDEEKEDKRSASYKHSEGRIHSSEKKSRGSEEGSTENHPHQLKRHESHLPKEDEESDESEDVEKRYYQPKYYQRKHKLHKSTEDKRINHSDKRTIDEDSDESDDEETKYMVKKSYKAPNYDKEPSGNYHHPRHHEQRNSDESHSSEEVEKKRHQSLVSEEEWPKRNYGEENSKEKRYDSGESEERSHHFEKKRQPYMPHWELKPHYEEEKQHSDERLGIIGKPYAKSSAEEKRHYSEDQEDEEPGTQNSNENKEEKRHYFGEESMGEEKRYHPSNFAVAQDIDKRRHNEEAKSDAEESEEHLEEMKSQNRENYKPYYNEDIDKRAVRQYSPYNKQLWWNSRRFEKRSNVGSQNVDSEGLNKHNRFLPEYNDYDLWEKRQLMDGMNPDYIEKRNPARMHKFDIKRQYNRMDELAQLLNYKKKSVEFPDLYNSEEGLKKRHLMPSRRGNLIQRPLTAEEEKELENLAAMDLELQKIAEKLNDNRRG
ncbi:secretogranin-1 [Ambystoma mexicanum]|uniref:secretogranin-1 n=1 Tax=Ambystoma mexicanum TaxID=8296 RepID=UPI0037E73272